MSKLYCLFFLFSYVFSSEFCLPPLVTLKDNTQMTVEHYNQKSSILKQLLSSFNYHKNIKILHGETFFFKTISHDLKSWIVESVKDVEIEDLDCNFIYVVRNCLIEKNNSYCFNEGLKE